MTSQTEQQQQIHSKLNTLLDLKQLFKKPSVLAISKIKQHFKQTRKKPAKHCLQR